MLCLLDESLSSCFLVNLDILLDVSYSFSPNSFLFFFLFFKKQILDFFEYLRSMLLKADLMQVFMNADVLFSSHLFGGRIPPSFFFFATFLYGSHFSQNMLEKKKMVIMGRVSSSSGLPGGKATPESFLKIQIL